MQETFLEEQKRILKKKHRKNNQRCEKKSKIVSQKVNTTKEDSKNRKNILEKQKKISKNLELRRFY